MNTEKMNVHKALVELKTLDGRIHKAINACQYVLANKHSNAKINGMPVDKVCKQMSECYQQAKDLIVRRNAIKRAVVQSNAVTHVVISGRDYTVAEAIEMKNNGIVYLQTLLSKLNADYVRAQREANANNGDALESRADDYIKSLCGNTDMKNASEDIKKVRADFIAAQTFELVDPIKAKDEMERLEKEINEFIVDVDSQLSVSNATTEIEVTY